MKCLSVLLLSAAAAFAADTTTGFMTGQAARLVIGQPTFTSQDTNSSDIVLGGASGIAYAGDTLFVADSNRVGSSPINHRVLLFQNLSSMLPSPTAELPYNRKCPVCLGRATLVLGQPDFTSTTMNVAATRNSLRLPTAVASDGVHVVVADTDHNRVLIWNTIPSVNNGPADVVIGQDNFTSVSIPPNNVPTQKSLRGPQGVWIQNGKLFVADTQNNRVLIWNSIPTQNGAPADIVLGAPSFTSYVEQDLTGTTATPSASNMLNPVAVTSDGVRLFVTDLGYNRVLIWRAIPTANTVPADLVIGQPDMTTGVPNYAYTVDSTNNNKQTAVLCTESTGTDTNGNATYPGICNRTLNFPRFALSNGTQLFVADGGNDRVLVFNQFPTENAPTADSVIGQMGGTVNQASDAADSLRAPLSLAWDGTNLYVSDAYNRRITAYSMARNSVPYAGVRNAASLAVYATGAVTIGGEIQAGDTITVTINDTANEDNDRNYSYVVKAEDTLHDVVNGVVFSINSANDGTGDPDVTVSANLTTEAVLLTARESGETGNTINYSVKVGKATSKSSALITAAAGGTTLRGGGDAARLAPGTIISILGDNLTQATASADTRQDNLPVKLAGTQAYINGIAAPLFMVSPTEVRAQIPWEVQDTTSISAYVRAEQNDGTVLVTTPVAATIVPANPGIFPAAGTTGQKIPPALALHASSYALGAISVDGSIQAGDIATVTIENRSYSYTVQSGDTLISIRDALISLINQDPKVTATPAGEFTRIILTARVQGPAGNGITYTGTQATGSSIVISAFGAATCCANVEGASVTPGNPAVAGEFIIIQATGLGLPVLNEDLGAILSTGSKFPSNGPVTSPKSSVSSMTGETTADVIYATLLPGTVGTYKVMLHLNSGLVTNPLTQLTISQDSYTSNIVTLPIVVAP